MTRSDTPIQTIADLKGKRVAVTRGTDPHIFLLRALAGAGLTEHDVKIVPLQHSDGRLALDRGDVDAWAGLDPFMAQAELESHDRLFFRNPDLNTYGVLNVREAFLAEHPEESLRETIASSMERGFRHRAFDHKAEPSPILAEAAETFRPRSRSPPRSWSALISRNPALGMKGRAARSSQPAPC